ncbi:MAG: tetratricopeptide repeat-containing sulfotransferase family protein, partial [Gammaproteobacteria bacterium]
MADDNVIDPIVAAVQSGHLAAAERLCRQLLAREPDQPDVLLLLGIALRQQDRPRDALVPFARLTELHPDDGMHWGNYAAALNHAGDVEAAEQAATRAVELTPGNRDRLEQLGLLRLQLGRPRDALAVLMQACGLAPESASVHIHAARACAACRDRRADDLLKPWREWLPLAPDLQFELADLLVQISEPCDALELLEDLVARTPTNWSAQLLLAKVYERVNQTDRAEAKLEWIVVTIGSNAGEDLEREIEAQRAQLAMRRHEFAVARGLLEHAGPGHDADDGHYFSLAKACDMLRDAPAAMAALQTAHALQIDGLRESNADLLEPGAPLLPGVGDRVTDVEYHSWPALRAPDTSQSPVFVVGFPRSGTTLLEQMLDAHPRLQSMDERPFFNTLANHLADIGIIVPKDLGKLSQRDCDELRKGYVLMGCGKVARRWYARLVDKNPLNMLWLPLIYRLFPQAQFILALRHPCDVVWSCYLQNFRAAPLVAACRSLTNLASTYVATMQTWLYHAQVFQPDMLLSRYEDLVADTSVQTGRIATFLGLEDAEPLLHFNVHAQDKGFIRTPSYTQVVEPINDRGVGHWQQYRPFFDEVL